MPQINVLPSAYRDGGAREKAAAAIAAQAETVKCADILSSQSFGRGIVSGMSRKRGRRRQGFGCF